METILLAATVLGGAAALGYFIDKWRGSASPTGSGLRAAEPELQHESNGGTARSQPLRDEPQQHAVRDTTPVANPSAASPEESRGQTQHLLENVEGRADAAPRYSTTALPLDAVLNVLSGDEFTPLQKSEFVKRHHGTLVLWEGRIENIKKLWEHEDDSDIIAVLAPIVAQGHRFGQLATVVFPKDELSAVLHLRRGTNIVVEGVLRFTQSGGDWSAGLERGRYIRTVEAGQRDGRVGGTTDVT